MDLSTNHNTYLKFSTGKLLKLGLVEKVVKVKISLTGRLSYENIFGCKVKVLGLFLVRGYLAKGLTKGLKIEP